MRISRAMAGFGAAGAVAIAVVACSSFTSSDPPGTDASVSADATAAADVTAPEADAGADAGAQWIPCAKRAPAPLGFCDDFDEPGRLDFHWTSKTEVEGGVVGETAAASSAPRAAHPMLLASASNASSSARIFRTVGDASSAKKLTLSFALRWDAVPYAASASGSGYMVVGAMVFDGSICGDATAPLERSMALVFYPPDGLALGLKSFVGQCPKPGFDDFTSLQTPTRVSDFKTWKRLRMVVAKGGCPNQPATVASVTVGGDDLPAAVCRGLAVDPFAYAKDLSFTVGLNAGGGPHEAAEASIDDVTFDVE